MPITKRKPVPDYQSEDEERRFWEQPRFDGFLLTGVLLSIAFPKLKPTLRTISVSLPVSMIEDLKVLANKRDVPYQSLLKMFLTDRIKKGATPRIVMPAGRSAESACPDPLRKPELDRCELPRFAASVPALPCVMA